MKTVIALFQAGEKGKTSSLRFLAKQIMNDFDTEVIFLSHDKIPEQTDFRLIIKVKVGSRIIIVAIESQGDPKTNLQRRLFDIEDTYHCDIIFCTTRTRGETVSAVDRLWQERGYRTIWTSPYQISGKSQQTIVNELMGKHLIELAQSLDLI